MNLNTDDTLLHRTLEMRITTLGHEHSSGRFTFHTVGQKQIRCLYGGQEAQQLRQWLLCGGEFISPDQFATVRSRFSCYRAVVQALLQ